MKQTDAIILAELVARGAELKAKISEGEAKVAEAYVRVAAETEKARSENLVLRNELTHIEAQLIELSERNGITVTLGYDHTRYVDKNRDWVSSSYNC